MMCACDSPMLVCTCVDVCDARVSLMCICVRISWNASPLDRHETDRHVCVWLVLDIHTFKRICTHTDTYIHTYHTYVRTYIHTYINTFIQSHAHTYVRSAYTHAYMRTMRIRRQTHTLITNTKTSTHTM